MCCIHRWLGAGCAALVVAVPSFVQAQQAPAKPRPMGQAATPLGFPSPLRGATVPLHMNAAQFNQLNPFIANQGVPVGVSQPRQDFINQPGFPQLAIDQRALNQQVANNQMVFNQQVAMNQMMLNQLAVNPFNPLLNRGNPFNPFTPFGPFNQFGAMAGTVNPFAVNAALALNNPLNQVNNPLLLNGQLNGMANAPIGMFGAPVPFGGAGGGLNFGN